MTNEEAYQKALELGAEETCEPIWAFNTPIRITWMLVRINQILNRYFVIPKTYKDLLKYEKKLKIDIERVKTNENLYFMLEESKETALIPNSQR